MSIPPSSIYIYAPPSERHHAERLAQPWQAAAQPCLLSSAADLTTLPASPCAALIVLYTPALAEDEGLFTLLQRTHTLPGLRRFFFLPHTNGADPLPPIFHLNRAQQLTLYRYPADSACNLDAVWMAYENDVRCFLAPPTPPRNRLSGKRPSLRRLLFVPLFATLLIAAWLLWPGAWAALSSRITTPPPATEFWLQADGNQAPGSEWQRVTQQDGNPLTVESRAGSWHFAAQPPTRQAALRLTSRSTWPLQDWHSLGFAFHFEAAPSPQTGAAAQWTVRLISAEQGHPILTCWLVAEPSGGKLQCALSDLALSEPIPCPAQTWQHVIIALDKSQTAVQLYLNDQPIGQRSLPPDWRTGQVALQIEAQVENLNTNPISLWLDDVFIAHKP